MNKDKILYSCISLIFFLFCSVAITTSCGIDPQKQKLTKYMLQGKSLYVTHCSNCHQSDGQGLKGIYPAIANGIAINDLNFTVCMIKNGSSVDSKSIVKMPANAQLTPLDIATIVTYIRNSWGSEEGLVPVKDISKILEKCK